VTATKDVDIASLIKWRLSYSHQLEHQQLRKTFDQTKPYFVRLRAGIEHERSGAISGPFRRRVFPGWVPLFRCRQLVRQGPRGRSQSRTKHCKLLSTSARRGDITSNALVDHTRTFNQLTWAAHSPVQLTSRPSSFM